MPTTTVSAAEMRIDRRLRRLADEEHWNITTRLLDRIIREAGRAADAQRPADVVQPGKAVAARAARVAALAREPEPTAPATGGCHLAPGCKSAAVGWRLYVHDGWKQSCPRHMGASGAVGRRHNRDLGAADGQR